MPRESPNDQVGSMKGFVGVVGWKGGDRFQLGATEVDSNSDGNPIVSKQRVGYASAEGIPCAACLGEEDCRLPRAIGSAAQPVGFAVQVKRGASQVRPVHSGQKGLWDVWPGQSYHSVDYRVNPRYDWHSCLCCTDDGHARNPALTDCAAALKGVDIPQNGNCVQMGHTTPSENNTTG